MLPATPAALKVCAELEEVDHFGAEIRCGAVDPGLGLAHSLERGS
jgi:hypothetical protein